MFKDKLIICKQVDKQANGWINNVQLYKGMTCS